ncbi:MAG: SWIM zinc finger family protein [Candidatus Ornithomonoglobus sp.]
MNDPFDFGIWDESIQAHPDQKKRFTRALTSKLIPLSIDTEKQSGVFNGSKGSTYNTTLEFCSCVDFIRRKLPCKHIYRLAVELGMVDTSNIQVAKGDYGTDDKTLKDKIKVYIDTLDEENAHILARYFYEFDNKIGHKLMRKEKVPEVVLSCEVFEDIGNLQTKLTKLKRTELIELFADTNLKVKYLSKPDLIQLALNTENINLNSVSDMIVDLSVKKLYKPVLNPLHMYVHRIYPRHIDDGFVY